MPLDREGVRKGVLNLSVAYTRPRSGSHRYLLALSGGPGQSSVAAARSFRDSLEPALKGSGFAVLDQRGTGDRGLLCPGLQKLGGIDAVPVGPIVACADRLGGARADYGTADSVADIDALRRKLGAPKLTLMGVSYGTYVAVQYARTYPQRVEGLILDSPVRPSGLDTFLLDSSRYMRRVVDSWCTGIRCPASVGQPWQSLTTVADRLQTVPISSQLADDGVLGRLIGSADLNPALQALLPGALHVAAKGDPQPLVRLLAAARGPSVATRDLSAGLNMATLCADVAQPFATSDSESVRRAKLSAALMRIPDSYFAPFSRKAIGEGSIASDCSVWPSSAGGAAPSAAPLPDVRALILSGTFDQRTPTEGARELRTLLPHSNLLTVRGTGHDTIDTDASGCVARALSAFASRRAIGRPCGGVDNRWRVAESPAASIGSARPASGRLRRSDATALGAIAATIQDARLQAYALLYAGYRKQSGPGRFGGSFAASDDVALRRYQLIKGVAVSFDPASGRINASLPGGGRAVLSVTEGGLLRGTLNGRSVVGRSPVAAAVGARGG